MKEIDNLLEVMNRLRGDNGCNWDKKQTHESLTPYLLEESYEVVDALERNDQINLKEELGDLLFQIVFHSKIADENNTFHLRDVASSITDKLIRRHPHVFEDQKSLDSEEVVVNWAKLKEKEKRDSGIIKQSILDDIPNALPALQKSLKIQEKVSEVGFDWDSLTGVFQKVKEELSELEEEIFNDSSSKERKEEELGDLMFTLVNLAKFLKINPETALRKANQKFNKRFRTIEKYAKTENKNILDLTKDEMEELWQISKNIDNL